MSVAGVSTSITPTVANDITEPIAGPENPADETQGPADESQAPGDGSQAPADGTAAAADGPDGATDVTGGGESPVEAPQSGGFMSRFSLLNSVAVGGGLGAAYQGYKMNAAMAEGVASIGGQTSQLAAGPGASGLAKYAGKALLFGGIGLAAFGVMSIIRGGGDDGKTGPPKDGDDATDPGQGPGPGDGVDPGDGTDPGNGPGDGTDPGDGSDPGNGPGDGTDPGNGPGDGTDPGDGSKPGDENPMDPDNGKPGEQDPGQTPGQEQRIDDLLDQFIPGRGTNPYVPPTNDSGPPEGGDGPPDFVPDSNVPNQVPGQHDTGDDKEPGKDPVQGPPPGQGPPPTPTPPPPANDDTKGGKEDTGEDKAPDKGDPVQSGEICVDDPHIPDEHIVVKGDNLSAIARNYDTTWREIYWMNQDIIKHPDLIYPGQVLQIPQCDIDVPCFDYTLRCALPRSRSLSGHACRGQDGRRR